MDDGPHDGETADPAGPTGEDRLNPAQRAEAIATLAATTPEYPLDLLVVGGGVVGAGAALDAASRGLRVALVEQRDLASGTSSRSSRLAHGGLRYLEHREFSLVHEALTERGLLLERIAPHLVQPLAFLLPLAGRSWERPYFGAGVTLYDLLSRVGAYGGQMPRPRTLSRAAVRGLAPGLAADKLKGGVRFHDAQIDDARHVLALARTAASYGAAIVTRCGAVAAIQDDADPQRVAGFSVEVDGATIPVHARCVLSATGVWTNEFKERAHVPVDQGGVRQAKGVHLIVPRDRIRSSNAVIARTPTSVLFLLPWVDKWLIGTTDTDYEGDLADPRATAEDVDYLLEQANRWLAQPLTRDDIVGVYCGLRPLVAAQMAEPGQTAQLSREHVVLRPATGLVMVAGGKYTTYRVMARDAVDAVVADLAESPGRFEAREPDDSDSDGGGSDRGEPDVRPCRTADIPVVGAAGYLDMWQSRSRLAREWGLDEEQVVHLLRRHGDRATRVAELVAPDPGLGERLHPDAPYLVAEVVVAVMDEGARTVEDVLVRRTRVALETADVGRSALPRTLAVMADLLQWSDTQKAAAGEQFTSDWPVSWHDEIAAVAALVEPVEPAEPVEPTEDASVPVR